MKNVDTSGEMSRSGRFAPVAWLNKTLVSVPLIFVLIILLWEWSIRIFHIPELLLPRPITVIKTFIADLTRGVFWPHLSTTLVETLLGFVGGTVAGILVAALFVHSKFFERAFYPYVVALQTFPKVAIAPLLITWFGFGILPKAILGGLLTFFPVLVNMMIGLRSVPREQLELLESLKASQWEIFRIARLPASLHYLFGALETGIVLTILGVITAEFVGARKGLGYLVVQKNAVMSIDGVFGVLLLLGILGVTVHLIAKVVHKRIVFWE